MKAILMNFRGPYKQQKASNQMIVRAEGSETKESAEKLVGKTIVWTSSAGKTITGKISAVHGSKGAVRVIFEKGMPGQAIGTQVNIE